MYTSMLAGVWGENESDTIGVLVFYINTRVLIVIYI